MYIGINIGNQTQVFSISSGLAIGIPQYTTFSNSGTQLTLHSTSTLYGEKIKSHLRCLVIFIWLIIKVLDCENC